MSTYEDMITEAIERETELITRDVAVRHANTVDGLDLDEQGTIKSLDRPGKDVLHDLVEAFREIQGHAAATLIAYRLRKTFDLDKVDLPDNIESVL